MIYVFNFPEKVALGLRKLRFQGPHRHLFQENFTPIPRQNIKN